MKYLIFLLSVLFVLFSTAGDAQKNNSNDKSLVYLDKDGVMRWRKDNTEASFFGVNYTTPFAYAYRAHKALNVDLEKAISQDVYHMARLGLDAFRVHVWDNEISDVSGNLLENEHLRLFDFLLAELKKRNIKTIITPIAFWGNGYPEHDENTPGFSMHYGRGKLTTDDSAIVAQENYLKQFFSHINPYTKVSYKEDPDVIAVEINNEPSHNDPKSGVTNYINRLAAAIKSTGWSKPLFYNISQGPYFADAVAASVVNGFSFQWYPTGLVSGSELKGNYLPNVDRYTIPFDTIPAFAKKALMVYEFDAADILQSTMYPAMARSFRTAGFQWATQFAYDPMNLAYANTEYQTHYLNLAYTPSKAVSMLIASRVFHKVPRLKNYGTYPADSVFDVFRISYKERLSEMNSDQEFYYSNSTTTKPLNATKLQHIAGVGSSPTIKYDGLGLYFLDRIDDGVWRLEVMPDAISIRDPFERPSPSKEVTRILWNSNRMLITIPNLGPDFSIEDVNKTNSYVTNSSDSGFQVPPGTYLLTRKGKKYNRGIDKGVIKLNEFVAPQPGNKEMYLSHQPYKEVSAGKPISLRAKVVGMDTGKVFVQISQATERFKIIPMIRMSASEFVGEIPVDILTPGQLNYKIIIRQGKNYVVFPGGYKGNPFAWDNYHNETWKTFVAVPNTRLELFNPTTDRNVQTYPTFMRGFQTHFITGEKPEQLILSMTANELSDSGMMGFQYSFVDKLKGRLSEMNSFTSVVVRGRSSNELPLRAKVTIAFWDGSAVSAFVSLTNDFKDIEIPISRFTNDSALLMPRPYPGFLPLTFGAGKSNYKINLLDAEKIELTIGPGVSKSDLKKTFNLEVEGIWLQKQTSVGKINAND